MPVETSPVGCFPTDLESCVVRPSQVSIQCIRVAEALKLKDRANLYHARQTPIAYADDNVLLSSNLTHTGGFHTSSTTHLLLRGSRAHSCILHLYFNLLAHAALRRPI